MSKTPDQQLSETIISKIAESSLVLETELDKFKQKLNSNALSEEDIILFLENKILSEKSKESTNE